MQLVIDSVEDLDDLLGYMDSRKAEHLERKLTAKRNEITRLHDKVENLERLRSSQDRKLTAMKKLEDEVSSLRKAARTDVSIVGLDNLREQRDKALDNVQQIKSNLRACQEELRLALESAKPKKSSGWVPISTLDKVVQSRAKPALFMPVRGEVIVGKVVNLKTVSKVRVCGTKKMFPLGDFKSWKHID